MSWLNRLAAFPARFDFHAVLRRFEASRAFPRLGEAERPSDEPLRVGQTPSSAFSGAALTAFEPGEDGGPARLQVSFFGLWGPHGPLPSHLTEYAHERLRNAGDATLARFADVFHHRMFLLFHKAWARARPSVSMDRPETDAFARYVGALEGLDAAIAARTDVAVRWTALHYAALLASPARNPDGLRQLVADHFEVPAAVEEFVGGWIEVPDGQRWRLGHSSTRLGEALLGRRVFGRTHAFRLILGPLPAKRLLNLLPGTEPLRELRQVVRLYTNDDWAWELRLVAAASPEWRMRLGRSSRLGWTSRLGTKGTASITLTIDPATGRTRREHRTSPG